MTEELDLTDINVLVIDDESFMLQLLTRILTEIGISGCETARDGQRGLAKVMEMGNDLDLIICDLQIPQMNGFEFVRQLRASQGIGDPSVPVLVVTGHSEREQVKEAVNAGINGFLVKPVSKQALESRMRAALKSRRIDPNRVG